MKNPLAFVLSLTLLLGGTVALGSLAAPSAAAAPAAAVAAAPTLVVDALPVSFPYGENPDITVRLTGVPDALADADFSLEVDLWGSGESVRKWSTPVRGDRALSLNLPPNLPYGPYQLRWRVSSPDEGIVASFTPPNRDFRVVGSTIDLTLTGLAANHPLGTPISATVETARVPVGDRSITVSLLKTTGGVGSDATTTLVPGSPRQIQVTAAQKTQFSFEDLGELPVGRYEVSVQFPRTDGVQGASVLNRTLIYAPPIAITPIQVPNYVYGADAMARLRINGVEAPMRIDALNERGNVWGTSFRDPVMDNTEFYVPMPPGLEPGNYTLRLSFSDPKLKNESPIAPVAFTVAKIPTTLTLGGGRDTFASETATLSATLAGGEGNVFLDITEPDGRVRTVPAQKITDGGSAVYGFEVTKPGAHRVVARYAGDRLHTEALSAPQILNVLPRPLALSVDPASQKLDQANAFRVQVRDVRDPGAGPAGRLSYTVTPPIGVPYSGSIYVIAGGVMIPLPAGVTGDFGVELLMPEDGRNAAVSLSTTVSVSPIPVTLTPRVTGELRYGGGSASVITRETSLFQREHRTHTLEIDGVAGPTWNQTDAGGTEVSSEIAVPENLSVGEHTLRVISAADARFTRSASEPLTLTVHPGIALPHAVFEPSGELDSVGSLRVDVGLDGVAAEPVEGAIEVRVGVPTSEEPGTQAPSAADRAAAEPAGVPDDSSADRDPFVLTGILENGRVTVDLPADLPEGILPVSVRYLGSENVAPAHTELSLLSFADPGQPVPEDTGITVGIGTPRLHPGDQQTLRLSGLPANSAAAAVLFSDARKLGTVHVDEDGIGTLTFPIPADLSLGTHRVEVRTEVGIFAAAFAVEAPVIIEPTPEPTPSPEPSPEPSPTSSQSPEPSLAPTPAQPGDPTASPLSGAAPDPAALPGTGTSPGFAALLGLALVGAGLMVGTLLRRRRHTPTSMGA
ncbi:methionine-rich copper-binding protein CopC [Mycetocola sp. BIGb0189]|uniref:hypothetical protein n=1 Tax=Mycetocola sp. BIGb0189 TaxID=2940604 RepID=UPI00216A04AE|nr:hypothetical protein [Mycetocola sp. BIGb0189]MCS4277436.1 methionine-rich copper-binding protein CopC [Mycetocola sp. BIGb0189]